MCVWYMYVWYEGKKEDCLGEEEDHWEERGQREWYEQDQRFEYKNIIKSAVLSTTISSEKN